MYEHLPQMISPIALSIGGFSVRWYGLMWLVAFAVTWLLLMVRVRLRENQSLHGLTNNVLGDMVLMSALGGVIGGRLGYALFYDYMFFSEYPSALVWPFVNGHFTGISGMSFHGGAIGILCVLFFYAQKYKWSFLALTDFVVPAIPLGYFFGRLGNFLNHELWGRVTTYPIGMYFAEASDGGTVLRHPSQLYEAFFEGIVLFVLLWVLRNRFTSLRGFITGVFVCGYSVARYGVEFFREPDAHIGFVVLSLSMGQALSILMFLCGIILVYYSLQCRKYT